MEEESKEASWCSKPNSKNPSPRGVSPRASPGVSPRNKDKGVHKLKLLTTGDTLTWGTDPFTTMKTLETLTLQGHTNAVEFFGINLRTLKYLELDMLDELKRRVQGGGGGSILYQGRVIQTNLQNIQGWEDYVVQLFREKGQELH